MNLKSHCTPDCKGNFDLVMEGMSEKEAARALGITQGALKARLHRARKALEKVLNEEVELE